MTVIRAVGPQGSGKTTIGVYNALFMSYNYHCPIWSNINIKLPKYHRIKLDDFLNVPEYIYFLVDEANRYADARKSMSWDNLITTDLVQELRKIHIEATFCTQLDSQVDVRIRDQCDIVIFCLPRYKESTDDFGYYIVHLSPIEWGEIRILSYEFAYHYLFPYFDSYERVDPLYKKAKEFYIREHNPDLLWPSVFKLIDKLEPYVDKWTMDGIGSMLGIFEEDLGYTKYIHMIKNGVLNLKNLEMLFKGRKNIPKSLKDMILFK